MKRVKYSNLLIIGILIYIIFQIAILILGKTTSTIVLTKEQIEEKNSTKGLFIREEQLVSTDTSGDFVIKAKEGEKIKSNQIIGEVYKDRNKVIDNNKEIEVLNKEIKDLQKQNSDLTNSFASTIIKTKKEQVKLLESQTKTNISYINSPASGIVSYKYDGNEDLYNLEKINSLSKEDIENASNYYKNTINTNENIKKEQIVARIINNNESYVAIYVDLKEGKNFKENLNMKVRFNQNILNVVVNNIYQKNNYAVVILKITDQNVEIYDTRVKEFDIIYKQVEGLKIPKTCVKKVNNKQGVYIVNQQTKKTEFVELKGIQYEDKDYIYIDDYKNDIEGIKTVRANDEVILKPNSINTHIKISR